jgi:hypothetical protein
MHVRSGDEVKKEKSLCPRSATPRILPSIWEKCGMEFVQFSSVQASSEGVASLINA